MIFFLKTKISLKLLSGSVNTQSWNMIHVLVFDLFEAIKTRVSKMLYHCKMLSG